MIKNLVGPPVRGNDFVGRKQELAAAEKSIIDGNSLLLSSPRRVGKSSFAHYIVDDLSKRCGWDGLYIDLQGLRYENNLADLLISHFSTIPLNKPFVLQVEKYIDKGLEIFSKVSVKDVGAEFNVNASKPLNLAEKHISATRNKCVVVLDEVAVFLEELTKQCGVNRTELILNWLRKMRLGNSERISWIYCSSVSIQSFCSKYNLSHTINDLQSVNLGELCLEEATELLYQLDEKTKYFKPGQIDFILDRIGFKLPFFVQLFYSKYSLMYGSFKGNTIEERTEQVLDSLEKEQFLDSWSERLEGYGDNQRVARILLNYISQPCSKTDRDTLMSVISSACSQQDELSLRLSIVKQMLERDGYIIPTEEGGIIFRSPIIRDYWFKKFVR